MDIAQLTQESQLIDFTLRQAMSHRGWMMRGHESPGLELWRDASRRLAFSPNRVAGSVPSIVPLLHFLISYHIVLDPAPSCSYQQKYYLAFCAFCASDAHDCGTQIANQEATSLPHNAGDTT